MEPDDLIELARRRFAGPVAFQLSAPELKYLPPADVPEIAFAGRSNVGKSSLLNAITGRHGLARASVTPGRTQELNVFNVGDPTLFRLIDMPGYGFADAPKDVVRQWKHLVYDYLRGRAVLKRVLVLIDSRHGIKPVDREIMSLLDKAAVSFQVVLTKADKIKPSALETLTEATLGASRIHPAAYPQVIASSAEKGLGIPELRAAVLAAATDQ
ncbi:MAG: ribosome biogenesis GTP-binding protein YihA/YsxC [Alphaproteobacteria bacterium]|nr:ribosome biogenesis GTP-binding protein YihA/YsxC [Alphaproteobacteria bacterium]